MVFLVVFIIGQTFCFLLVAGIAKQQLVNALHHVNIILCFPETLLIPLNHDNSPKNTNSKQASPCKYDSMLGGLDTTPARWIDLAWQKHLQFRLFSVPTSCPQLVHQTLWHVLSCLWESVYKRSLVAYWKEYSYLVTVGCR